MGFQLRLALAVLLPFLSVTFADQVCTLTKADIIIVIDESSSLSASDFQKEKEFVRTVVNTYQISPTGIRFGIVEFATIPYYYIKNDFLSLYEECLLYEENQWTGEFIKRLSDFDTTESFLQFFDTNLQATGFTDIIHALNETKQAFEFDGRSDPDVVKIVIFQTDGTQTFTHPDVSHLTIQAAADALKEIAVVYAIGVGSDIDSNILQNQVATHPLYYYEAADFEELASTAFINELITGVCTPIECEIMGVIYDVGDVNPNNPCLYCNTSVNAFDWTPKADGGTCDDGDACTSPDTCNNGTCQGQAIQCNTCEQCNAGQCTAIPGCGQCSIGGTFYNDQASNPSNPECQFCDFDNNPNGWTNRAAQTTCNDGNSCTTGDTCGNNAICSGRPVTCSDCEGCSQGSCVPDVSKCVAKCLIQGTIYDEDDQNPANECQICKPSVRTDGWTNKASSASCNDQDSCTTNDICGANAQCSGTAITCNDCNSCAGGVCIPDVNACTGQCLINEAIYGEDDENPDNQCQICKPSSSLTTWTNKDATATCSDGNACTRNDVCGDNAQCRGTPITCDDCQSCSSGTCGLDVNACTNKCLIGGTVYDANQVNPANQCQICSPSDSKDAWTNKASTATCDDGNACTRNDVCGDNAQCRGTPITCDDCQSCSFGTCGLDVNACTNKCLIRGTVYDANEVNPANQCQICSPSDDKDAWTNKASTATCDDGNACTQNDVCGDNAQCQGTPIACDDCQSCSSGTCGLDVNACTNKCLIGGTVYNANQVNPANQCQICSPSDDKDAWTNKASTATCDDGNACTQNDVCGDNAQCRGTPITCDDCQSCSSGTCGLDVNACRNKCLIGGTVYNANQVNPANQCQICSPSDDKDAWTNKASTATCDDGNACTQNDVCGDNAQCRGTPITCDDCQSCASGTCGLDVNACTNKCLIGGTVYDANQVNPANQCQICSPSDDKDAWTNKASTATCDDRNACTQNDVCGDNAQCRGTPITCEDCQSCSSGTCRLDVNACTNKCLIGGTVYDANQVNPANQCQICSPSDDKDAWTNKASTATCDDGNACTQNDVCGDNAQCRGTPITCDDCQSCSSGTCGLDVNACTNKCLIGGTVYHANQVNPANQCQICSPSDDKDAWTNKASTATCDDGNACTQNDVCGDNAQCRGTPITCDDCQSCSSGTCGLDVNACTNKCLIGGTVYHANQVNPANQCQICSPSDDKDAWTNKASTATCDDGNACTQNDVCGDNAQCRGTQITCDDCQSCSSGTCGLDVNACTNKCLIGGTVYDANQVNPANQCQICSPSDDKDAWTNKASTATCDDGNACTQNDVCGDNAQCRGTSITCDDCQSCSSGTCGLDVNACTNKCLIGGTVYDANQVNPANQCQVCSPSDDKDAWTNKASTATCDDGNACTRNDVCGDNAQCRGAPITCDDCQSCSSGTCVPDINACAGKCLIGGIVYNANDVNPANQCKICLPSVSTNSWTNKPPTATCDDGNDCTENDVCGLNVQCQGTAITCDDCRSCSSGTCGLDVNACTDKCLIGGVVYNANDVNPANQCKICLPSVSTNSWTNKPPTATCDDGNDCTENDVCGLNVQCQGTAITCDDCRSCSSGTCGLDVNACTDKCLIGGTVYDANDKNPSNLCQICKPSVSTSSWTNRAATDSCDDGDSCTVNDVCGDNAQCEGSPLTCPTCKVCSGGECVFDADTCGDVCIIGGETYPNGTINPNNPCQICITSRHNDCWVWQAPGSSCDDGNSCTQNDVCRLNGACRGRPITCQTCHTCTDGVCVKDTGCEDVCIIGGISYPNGTTNPNNPCEICITSRHTDCWVWQTPGSSCDDGNSCTQNDVCRLNGACRGMPITCQTCHTCTDGVCVKDAGCEGKCADLDDLDLGFLLDKSFSQASNWDYVKMLVTKSVQEIGISENGHHAGVISFSKFAKIDIKLSDTYDFNTFSNLVQNLQATSGTYSNYHSALKLARNRFFRKSHGGRDDAEKVIVLIVDGIHSGSKNVVKLAKSMRKSGYVILVIGIGQYCTEDYLGRIAGSKNHVLLVDDANELGDADFVDKFTDLLCIPCDVDDDDDSNDDDSGDGGSGKGGSGKGGSSKGGSGKGGSGKGGSGKGGSDKGGSGKGGSSKGGSGKGGSGKGGSGKGGSGEGGSGQGGSSKGGSNKGGSSKGDVGYSSGSGSSKPSRKCRGSNDEGSGSKGGSGGGKGGSGGGKGGSGGGKGGKGGSGGGKGGSGSGKGGKGGKGDKGGY